MQCRANGFTLIEALVAMTVVAVLLAIAVPAWSHAKAAVDSGSVRAKLAASVLLLVEEDPITEGVHLRSTTGRTRLVFQPNGGNAGSNVTFTLCDSRGPAHATTLVLSNSGGLRTGRPTQQAAWNCAYGG